MSTILFKRLTGNGETLSSFNLKLSDINSDRLAMLFKLNQESLFLTSEVSNEGT